MTQYREPIDPNEAAKILRDLADKVAEGVMIVTYVNSGLNEALTKIETTITFEATLK